MLHMTNITKHLALSKHFAPLSLKSIAKHRPKRGPFSANAQAAPRHNYHQSLYSVELSIRTQFNGRAVDGVGWEVNLQHRVPIVNVE